MTMALYSLAKPLFGLLVGAVFVSAPMAHHKAMEVQQLQMEQIEELQELEREAREIPAPEAAPEVLRHSRRRAMRTQMY